VHERTGQVDINGAVRVGATHPEELPDYLGVARQRAALRLIDVEGKLEGHTLSVPFTSHPDDLEGLDHALQELTALAPVLEQRRQRGRRSPSAAQRAPAGRGSSSVVGAA
jgi:hypothetical protein